jgi:hypothetical protein
MFSENVAAAGQTFHELSVTENSIAYCRWREVVKLFGPLYSLRGLAAVYRTAFFAYWQRRGSENVLFQGVAISQSLRTP